MEFCPKCGSILIQKRTKDKCLRCGYYPKEKIKIKTSEKIESKKEIAVIRKEEMDFLPVVEINCRKCGHNQSYFWTVQTRSGDEAETKFFRCTKCNSTWREYR